MNELTKRQKELLQFIVEYIRDHQMPPTLSEMAQGLGVRSKNSVAKLLNALEEAGVIEKNATPRGIKVTEGQGISLQKNLISVPLLGSVPAGGPVLAEEHIEDWLDIPTSFAKDKGKTFLLRVSGESMIGAGIFDNDLVVVWQTQAVKDNDIVVAVIEGEVTVKRLKQRGKKMYLQAENPKFKNIYPEDEWQIQGKVVSVIRKYT